MKSRFLALLFVGVPLMLALTGCANTGKVVSDAASKVGEDTSGAMSRVESFVDDHSEDGMLSEGHAESGFVDDDAREESDRLHEDVSSDVSHDVSSKEETESSHTGE